MTDNVTNELLLEHMKKMQTELSGLKTRMDIFGTELRSIKAFMGSVKHDIAALVENSSASDAVDADLLRRVERIERRLELREDA